MQVSTISLYFAVTFPATSEIPVLYFALASAVVSKAWEVLRDDDFEVVLTVLSATSDSTNTHSTLMPLILRRELAYLKRRLARTSLTS